jgi:DNA helicase-2/ATP-dependent DNA helicase PcrA
MKTVELFKEQPEVLAYYRNRFWYLLVDEYQDTNSAQFVLIHLMAASINDEGEMENNICVVGDDDQSIYKFRGANIHNILNFEKVYPDAKVIKLEQNYRSTQNILQAANEVICNNSTRKDKALWSQQEKGDLIFYTQFGNDYEEADSIIRDIKNGVETGNAAYNEFAVLYRTNAQSRAFEERLIAANIPYRIVGALNFYARKEIKDCIAYLKTIDNGMDDLMVNRIINVPKRGIGSTTVDKIKQYAMDIDIGLYDALLRVDSIAEVKRAGATKISTFVDLIEDFKARLKDSTYSLETLMRDILDETGYLYLLFLIAPDNRFHQGYLASTFRESKWNL